MQTHKDYMNFLTTSTNSMSAEEFRREYLTEFVGGGSIAYPEEHINRHRVEDVLYHFKRNQYMPRGSGLTTAILFHMIEHCIYYEKPIWCSYVNPHYIDSLLHSMRIAERICNELEINYRLMKKHNKDTLVIRNTQGEDSYVSFSTAPSGYNNTIHNSYIVNPNDCVNIDGYFTRPQGIDSIEIVDEKQMACCTIMEPKSLMFYFDYLNKKRS